MNMSSHDAMPTTRPHPDLGYGAQESIRMGTTEWLELVPQAVSTQIKRLGLLGYSEHSSSNGSSHGSNGVSFVANGRSPATVESVKTGAVSTGQ